MKFTVWQDPKGEWRWTLRARNGKIIADSSESYKSRATAVRMCKRINFVFPIVDQCYVEA
jgi:uncharacterized protein YegP (UPF0339 family)